MPCVFLEGVQRKVGRATEACTGLSGVSWGLRAYVGAVKRKGYLHRDTEGQVHEVLPRGVAGKRMQRSYSRHPHRSVASYVYTAASWL